MEAALIGATIGLLVGFGCAVAFWNGIKYHISAEVRRVRSDLTEIASVLNKSKP